MKVRSSIRSVSSGLLAVGAASACALVGACAHAPSGLARAAGRAPATTAQMSADQMPELGEETPVSAASVAVAAVPGAGVHLIRARYDVNTPVARLCDNPKTKAVLDTDLPGLTTRPEFPFFKNMSLRTLQRMSHGQMSPADLAKVAAALEAIDLAEAQVPPAPDAR